MDVLRPVVELINFNLNIIKKCGFPAFSVKKGKKQPGEGSKSCFNCSWTWCGLGLCSVILLLV